MQRILAIVIGVGFLIGLGPAGACLAKESCRGTAGCCCAQPETSADQIAGALASSADRAPTAAPALRRGCACPTEMRGGPQEPAPSTV
ncbi:MAG TPA: hypothetical protein VNM87_06165, partial [Candidatus Udaeobacter sp.]|nr:hypothetical protein [Candidatus Udaeobacter sp.]